MTKFLQEVHTTRVCSWVVNSRDVIVVESEFYNWNIVPHRIRKEQDFETSGSTGFRRIFYDKFNDDTSGQGQSIWFGRSNDHVESKSQTTPDGERVLLLLGVTDSLGC